MNSSDPQGDLLQPLNASPADTGTKASQETDAIWAHIYRLQTVLADALVALVFLSLGIILFMGKQMTTIRARLAADRQSAQQMYADFQANTTPKVRGFVRALQTFATTNQDFAIVLEKYRPVLGPFFAPAPPAFPTNVATSSPPASPLPPKK